MRCLARWIACGIVALALSPAVPAYVAAQDKAADAPAAEGMSNKWAVAYGLTGLGVVLGLINICRPGKRKGDSVKLAS